MTAAVLSVLQDPRGKGGTATVVEVYRRWMDHHRPGSRREIWLDEQGPRGLRRLLRWDSAERDIPRVLPALQVPPYVVARPFVRRRVSSTYDEVHIIGASALHGWIARDLAPTLVWLATTVRDERTSEVLRRRPFTRRLAYTVAQPFLGRLEIDVLRGAHRVLTMSHHTADVLCAHGVASSRIEVVVVPVDTNRFCPPDDADTRRGGLFVGRAHDPRKGFDRISHLLQESRSLQERGVTAVSSGSAINAGTCVRWRYDVHDLPATYRSAEVLLLPSRQEGLGIVALEAMACGTPVVAWQCGGIDHILRESGGGVIVTGLREFQAAVDQLLYDSQRAQEMGAAGRSWILRHASLSAFLSTDDVFSL